MFVGMEGEASETWSKKYICSWPSFFLLGAGERSSSVTGESSHFHASWKLCFLWSKLKAMIPPLSCHLPCRQWHVLEFIPKSAFQKIPAIFFLMFLSPGLYEQKILSRQPVWAACVSYQHKSHLLCKAMKSEPWNNGAELSKSKISRSPPPWAKQISLKHCNSSLPTALQS